MELEILDESKIYAKIHTIKSYVANKRVIIAFSGGVDSSVLAYLSKLQAKEVHLVIQTGDSLASMELDYARRVANYLQLPLQIIKYNEFELSKDYAKNPENRCYFCKLLLHDYLEKIRQQMQFDLVLNGTNASDLQGHRPGYQAIIESSAISPLALVGLSKTEIRWIARESKLDVWDKPANPCLASRIKYDVSITSDLLKRVDLAESYIKSNFHINVIRVRDDGFNACIEIDPDELYKIQTHKIQSEIKNRLYKLGYEKVIFDKEGYRPMTPLRGRIGT